MDMHTPASGISKLDQYPFGPGRTDHTPESAASQSDRLLELKIDDSHLPELDQPAELGSFNVIPSPNVIEFTQN